MTAVLHQQQEWAGPVTWRRLATGGWRVDHALAGGGWTRVHVDSEQAAEGYAAAILDSEVDR